MCLILPSLNAVLVVVELFVEMSPTFEALSERAWSLRQEYRDSGDERNLSCINNRQKIMGDERLTKVNVLHVESGEALLACILYILARAIDALECHTFHFDRSFTSKEDLLAFPSARKPLAKQFFVPVIYTSFISMVKIAMSTRNLLSGIPERFSQLESSVKDLEPVLLRYSLTIDSR